jgi:hypothetical protein
LAIAIVLFISVIAALAARYFRGGLKTSVPRWIDGMVRRATARLPPEQRVRMDEEWRSHINDVDGNVEKIYVAVGLNLAAKRLISRNHQKLAREINFRRAAGNEHFHFDLAPCCQFVDKDAIVVVVDVVAVDEKSGKVTFICGTIHYRSCPNHQPFAHRSLSFPSRTDAELANLGGPPNSPSVAPII